MADSIPSAEAVVLILTSCTVGGVPLARWSEISRPGGQLGVRQVDGPERGGLGQFNRPRARGRLRPPGPPGPRATAAAAVDEHAVDRIGYRVECRLHPRQRAERLPSGFVGEAHFEDDTAVVLDPGPLERTTGQGGLDELSPVG